MPDVPAATATVRHSTRPPGGQSPPEWAARHLPDLGGHLVEVHCQCPVELASARFRGRQRHPGHLDPVLTEGEAAERITAARAGFRGPLRLGGPLLIVDTTQPVDAETVVPAVGRLLPAAAATTVLTADQPARGRQTEPPSSRPS